MFRLIAALALVSAIAISAVGSASQSACVQAHEVWVGHALEKMETIKPGMTRDDLLKVFRTEGGLSTGLHRTFVSQEERTSVHLNQKPRGDHQKPWHTFKRKRKRQGREVEVHPHLHPSGIVKSRQLETD